MHWRQKQADVATNYHAGIPGDSTVTSSDAIRTLTIEILAGKGPDLRSRLPLPRFPYVGMTILIAIAKRTEAITGPFLMLGVRLQKGFAWKAGFSSQHMNNNVLTTHIFSDIITIVVEMQTIPTL